MTPVQKTLFPSASPLSIDARAKLLPTLNASLADGIDLYSQLKLAHWNVKGPHFASLHPLFETLADEARARNDELAERGVALGGISIGTSRQVAKASRLDEPEVEATSARRLIEMLLGALGKHAEGLRAARELSVEVHDADTEDLLTGQIKEVEKSAWFLSASLES
ncbi:MAG TPA: DNA starvation/stationary phase protection protein Dps [Planctomycetota bacterium]|nr:DNA starvation/stationary phase protection protein Dps [Planctomycetota bacterium]